jgi:hypothetical protein
VADQVRFLFRNMLDTGFDTGSRQGIWTSETTMYVDLYQLFSEFARLLSYGGRYVCITGCYNDVTGGRSKTVSHIGQHDSFYTSMTLIDVVGGYERVRGTPAVPAGAQAWMGGSFEWHSTSSRYR